MSVLAQDNDPRMTLGPTGAPERQAGGSDPVLEARQITVRFGGVVALNHVDLAVPSGTVVGLIGPNGAGKSTLLAALSGFLRPTEGTVLTDGTDITQRSAHWRARSGIARSFQHPEMVAELTVEDHLRLACRMHDTPSRLWSDMIVWRGLRGSSSESEDESVQSILDLLDLHDVRHRLPSSLSLGTCRMVELARSLITDPQVLLLDEPASGLDAGSRKRLPGVLRSVVADGRQSLLLVEHDVDLVMNVCDVVHVLNFGEVVAVGAPHEVQSDAAVQEAYLGAPNLEHVS